MAFSFWMQYNYDNHAWYAGAHFMPHRLQQLAMAIKMIKWSPLYPKAATELIYHDDLI
jgi:hypothetical protein